MSMPSRSRLVWLLAAWLAAGAEASRRALRSAAVVSVDERIGGAELAGADAADAGAAGVEAGGGGGLASLLTEGSVVRFMDAVADAGAQAAATLRGRGRSWKPTLGEKPSPVDEAGRMTHVEDPAESVEDFERRQKPPFVSIPGQNEDGRLTDQQEQGVDGIFETRPEDFRDCMLTHQYAEPLQVVDSFHMASAVRARLQRGSGDADGEDVMVRPGGVYDDNTKGGGEFHVGTQMFANLEGISNPVQVMPHGPVAHWNSKLRVPIAGFLCMSTNHSDSAPVLHSFATPCLPTSLDTEGNVLDPSMDHFQVFIGTTRVAFANKTEAATFCLGYAEEIARDLRTQVWDAAELENAVSEPGTEPSAAPAPMPAPAPEAKTVTVTFDGDFDSVVGSDAGKFLEECSAALKPVKCTNVRPGSVRVDLEGDGEAVDAAVADIGRSGLDLDSFPKLTAADESAAPAPAPMAAASPSPADAFAAAPSPSSVARTSDISEAGEGEVDDAGEEEEDDKDGEEDDDGGQEESDEKDGDEDERKRMGRKKGGEGGKGKPPPPKKGGKEGGSFAVWKSSDLPTFIARTRKMKSPAGWTKGTKSLLVVVMDWKVGDNSMAPYSHQSPNAISHYRDTIFPEVKRKFEEMSYNQFSVQVTVVPEVVRYTRMRNQIPGRMPLPSLYEYAREAVQGHRTLGGKYIFNNYDLVFVIHPQVSPVGTKGVAWVGCRGAVCNGCETISDNFKIMVAVHELGHNLGLSHASSDALEYGNPFDWMGNYPDVVGLHYGLGYKYELDWITKDNIFRITDSTVGAVNDMVTLMPYDSPQRPQAGQVAGVQISLSANHDDVYLSYRATTAGDKRGVYVVFQSKDSPNSKLMDAACHSMSQQDAHLRTGWTFMDGSQTLVVKVVQQTAQYAKVHVYRTPRQANSVAGIRARKLFTDGRTKCPLTCQDSDLIISQTCAELQGKGYCRGGVLTLGGRRLAIGTDVCPQACNKCSAVMGGSPVVGGAGGGKCEDSNVLISGMNCPALRRRDACSLKTTSGLHVGRDLCPRSCSMCPKSPPSSSGLNPNNFPDPQPARQVGGAGSMGSAGAYLVEAREVQAEKAAIESLSGHHAKARGPSPTEMPCEDDKLWVDVDGNGCDVYKNTIASWGLDKVCKEQHNGAGSLHCRETCKTCTGLRSGRPKIPDSKCADNACIGKWMKSFGRCYQCIDHARECSSADEAERAQFQADCPLTCGLCNASTPEVIAAPGDQASEGEKGTAPASGTEAPPCEDADPSWCDKLGTTYCSDGGFADRCQRTCNLCPPAGAAEAAGPCIDKFSAFTCARYEAYGWCSRVDTKDSVRLQCPVTCGICTEGGEPVAKAEEDSAASGAEGQAPSPEPARPKGSGEKTRSGTRLGAVPGPLALLVAVSCAVAAAAAPLLGPAA